MVGELLLLLLLCVVEFQLEAALSYPPGSWLKGPATVGGRGNLPLGPPTAALASELEPDSPYARFWPGKNTSTLPEFVRLRVEFVEDDDAFSRFRHAMDEGYRTGNDGFYTRMDEDSERMLELMTVSPVGLALLEHRMPQIAERVDSFGEPRLFQFGNYQPAMSSDLFNMLFKLMWIVESFQPFEPVPGQEEVPNAETLLGPWLPWANWNIIEVGGGPGLHAATTVFAMGSQTYTIVDMPTQHAMQYKVLKRALGHNLVDQTFAFTPSSLRINEAFVLPSYDLFISTYALSELSRELRETYFWTYIIRSKRGFVIDNHEDIHLSRKGNASDSGDYAGLKLVWRLQDFGMDVRIRTKHEALSIPVHRSRTVVISWAWTEMTLEVLRRNKIEGFE